MNRDMKGAASELVGKTVANVLVKENDAGDHGQLFLVTTDGIVFEFWSGQNLCGTHSICASLDEVRRYMAPNQKIVYEAPV